MNGSAGVLPLLALLALHASWVGLGWWLLARLPGARDWPVLLAACVSYFTGALVHVLLLHALLLTQLPELPVVWVLLGLGLLALPRAVRDGRGAATGAGERGRWTRLDSVLLLALLPPAALIALQLLGLPDVGYDTVAFWNAKAAWLFHGARLDDPVFTDPLRVHANPDYPLYRPLLAAEQYLLLGAADDHLAKPGFALHLLAGLGLLFALLRDAAGRSTALLALGLLLWTPIMAAAAIHGSPGTTYVDVPLGLQFAASLGLLLRALRTREAADVAAAMLAASAAALMKNEGTIWCALLLPLGGCALLLGWRGAAPRALAWLLLPAAVLFAWKQVQAGLAPQIYIRAPTPAQLLQLPGIAPRMAAAWWQSLLDVQRWGLTGLVLLPTCLLGVLRLWRRQPPYGRRRHRAWLPGREQLARLALTLVLLGQFCAVLLGVMLLEIQKGGLANWMAHAWDRLILQLLPSALLLAVALNVRRAPAAAAPAAEAPPADARDTDVRGAHRPDAGGPLSA